MCEYQEARMSGGHPVGWHINKGLKACILKNQIKSTLKNMLFYRKILWSKLHQDSLIQTSAR